MITLQTPTVINSVLGGNAPINYDKLVLASITFDPYTKNISAQVVITSTTNPDMQEIRGTLQIDSVSSFVDIKVPAIDFYRRIKPSAGQRTAITALVNDSQNAVESGIISLGLVAGTQSVGV